MSNHTAEDELENEIMVAGAVLAGLRIAGLDVEPELDDAGNVTAAHLRVGFMKSTYRLTIERIPGTEREEPVAPLGAVAEGPMRECCPSQPGRPHAEGCHG